jgi:hypothetical protein
MTAEEMIRANAQLVIEQLGIDSQMGMEFGYNLESVKWIEGFIERQRSRPDATPETIDRLTQVLGSYLGECVIHVYGGTWRQHNGQWGVFFDKSNGVFPFGKVSKQFQNGAAGGDSIAGFFEAIDPLFKK